MKKLLFFCLLITIAFNQVFAVNFNDGEIHNIDYAIFEQHIKVDYQMLNAKTTLNLLNGGSTSDGYHVSAMNNSTVNISGGIVGGSLNANDNSDVVLNSGSIKLGFFGSGSSKIVMNGGTVNGTSALGTLHASENSQITFMSGRVNGYLFGRENSQIYWSGGSISRDIRIGHYTILTIDGFDFEIDGITVNSDTISSINGGDLYDETYRRLSGTLANGEQFSNDFRIGDAAEIIFIPEPSTILIIALGATAIRKIKN